MVPGMWKVFYEYTNFSGDSYRLAPVLLGRMKGASCTGSARKRHKVAKHPQTVVFSRYLNTTFSSPLLYQSWLSQHMKWSSNH